MKFVVIFGPHAVGKMTVGQELSKITGLKLFHNHMTIDLVSNFFNFNTSQGKRLVNLFRKEIFEEVSKSDLYGMIFTYMWAFDEQSENRFKALEQKYRLNSYEGEINQENYMRINNTSICPEQVAQMIKDKFSL
ncbi:AAA family ATPase [Senegalia massiliensis]|uniref:Shikimate kinase n=1 Tax=Senegalia massiliensis TaxID=1720316 RepID=A0A845QXJ6_9CLOT|nr:AAA family ATPase [Senegalia massiliensis]NBI05872.1 shikimate kinase [Senegalia massiliensis]